MTNHTKTPNIFIVQEEETISKLIEIKLDYSSGQVSTYSNGLDAFEHIQKEKPELVILDVMLPGMEGMEILKEIKSNEELSKIKVLMLTAKSREEDIKRIFELNADEYMSKPFNVDELKLRIKKLLD